MVVKRRFLLAVTSALTLVMAASAPMVASFEEAEPSPLRKENLLRVRDIAANGTTSAGAIVAVGWREASKPGQLYLAFSTNGPSWPWAGGKPASQVSCTWRSARTVARTISAATASCASTASLATGAWASRWPSVADASGPARLSTVKVTRLVT